jgi:nitrite reductase/ring-hydroxylating ferredoxin subunit
VHFGDAVVGRLGTATHERLTAIGDTVNIASRIEAANKEAGTRLLISEELHRLVEGKVAVRDFIRVRLRGAEERRSLYEISGLTPEARAALSGGAAAEQTQRFAGQTWHRLLDEASLPEGSRRIVERAEFDVQLVRANGAVFAFNNACPHLNLPFNESVLTGDGGIQCRWHESCFDLATGAIRTWCDALQADGSPVGHEELGNVSKNRRPMVVYPARIGDGGIWVSFDAV